MLPDFFFCSLFPVQQTTSGIGHRVCVCVFFPFILDINGRTSRGHTGGRSHRISHPPSFCGACLNFSRECVLTILIVLHPLGIFIFVF